MPSGNPSPSCPRSSPRTPSPQPRTTRPNSIQIKMPSPGGDLQKSARKGANNDGEREKSLPAKAQERGQAPRLTVPRSIARSVPPPCTRRFQPPCRRPPPPPRHESRVQRSGPHQALTGHDGPARSFVRTRSKAGPSCQECRPAERLEVQPRARSDRFTRNRACPK